MNYPTMLMRRSRYAYPRDTHETVASHIDQRNADAYLQWRIRWARRHALPDAWPNERAKLDRYRALAITVARMWMRTNVVNFSKKSKEWRHC